MRVLLWKSERVRGWSLSSYGAVLQRPEHDVPKRRANPEVVSGLDEVVTKMTLPQVQTDLTAQVEMMDRIVGCVVGKVARHEACKERRHKVGPEDQCEKAKEGGR